MSEVYRDGKVHVRADACDNCLFSGARLVRGEVARDIIADTRAKVGGSFVCHRSQVTDMGDAICARWWGRFAHEDWVLRLAAATGSVEFVSEGVDTDNRQD